MSNLSDTATMLEPSHPSLPSQEWIQFRNDYADARSNIKNSLPVTNDALSKEILRIVLQRLKLLDDCVERLTRHEDTEIGVLSAAIPLCKLSEPEIWSIVLPDIATGTAWPPTGKVDPIRSYRKLRTAMSQIWLEKYGEYAFDAPRSLKGPGSINGPTMNNFTKRLMTVAGESSVGSGPHAEALAWQGQVDGVSFDPEFQALNLQPNPGTMSSYLGNLLLTTNWSTKLTTTKGPRVS